MVLLDENGAHLFEESGYLGKDHTNNTAEYSGLIVALKAALAFKYRAIAVKMDS